MLQYCIKWLIEILLQSLHVYTSWIILYRQHTSAQQRHNDAYLLVFPSLESPYSSASTGSADWMSTKTRALRLRINLVAQSMVYLPTWWRSIPVKAWSSRTRALCAKWCTTTRSVYALRYCSRNVSSIRNRAVSLMGRWMTSLTLCWIMISSALGVAVAQ